MKERRLAVALGISAAVHLGVLGALVTTTPRPGQPAVMRVRVLSHGDPGAGEQGQSSPAVQPQPSPRPSPARVEAAARAPADRQPAPARSTPSSSASPIASAAATTRLTPVQSDIWVLTQPPAEPGATAGAPTAETAARSAGPRAAVGDRTGAPEGRPGSLADGQDPLLAELARRIAQSAARCAPPGAARRGWERDLGVPVHFCLDASGRPSEIGLQGTTGSNLLDRTALDCVVPGAAPLPPAPGCYTVEVRFPVRG